MKRKIGLTLLAMIVLSMVAYQIPQPSNDRDWTEDQVLIPKVTFEGDTVIIENVRDFHYRSTEDYDRKFITRSFQMSKVQTVDFILSQFAEWRGMAHAFLTFGYETDTGMEYLAISVEIRKEKGESYSPFWGMLKQYELAYVLATETDVIKLRTHYRQEPLYLYPIQVEAKYAQQLLKSMLEQTHRMETEPEFYNTVSNSCMSNVAKHVNAVKPGLVPFGWGSIFPGFADDVALELNLLDTDVDDIESVRQNYLINDKATALPVDANFSTGIRRK